MAQPQQADCHLFTLPVNKSYIQELCEEVPLALLKKHFQNYSEKYRSRKDSKSSIPGRMEKICYLVTRFPATFAAASFVFQEAKKYLPDAHSLLDLGAGPGTGLLAALHAGFPLRQATLIEESREFIELGSPMCPDFAFWNRGNLLEQKAFSSHDVTLFCYSLGEIPENKQKTLLKGAWEASKQALIIIEPGTPAAFKNLLDVRDFIIGQGGHVLAPCPHSQRCPLAFAQDWCHFSVRLQRTSLHRKIKEGALGYEDEKFCYMILSKNPNLRIFPRILKPPKKQAGSIDLELCTTGGIIEKKISSRDKELFKKAKKLSLGEVCNLEDY